MQELAHGRNHYLHGALAIEQEPITEGHDHLIVLLGDYCWHVQCLAQQYVARLGDGCSSRPLSRLADGGSEASMCDHLFGRDESIQGAEKGEQVAAVLSLIPGMLQSRPRCSLRPGCLSI